MKKTIVILLFILIVGIPTKTLAEKKANITTISSNIDDDLASIEATVTDLHVRSGPGSNFSVLGSINPGKHWTINRKGAGLDCT
ncbi:hypothetical protein ABFG93_18320 [Pseudalkalibacillus hwajinpoensis]|uniref:hypothetical protein n=1 Tax=Guptibacillus hwajinpoensis TaxID=208199 RepID=UPI00325BC7B3